LENCTVCHKSARHTSAPHPLSGMTSCDPACH
jgi:hypothetical protein